AMAPRFPTIGGLLELKKYWNVSAAALAYRLRDLNLLTDWQYRSLYVEMNQRGYLQQEPNSSQRESSQLLAKVFAALAQEGGGKDQVPAALKMPSDEINQLVFGLALTSVTGTDTPAQNGGGPKAKLRLIA